MLGTFFAKPKLHYAPGADQRGRDRGEAGGQAERRRHGQCSDGGGGTGQPNGFGWCRKISSRRDAEPQSSLPLAPGVIDRLQQGALGRGAVCAGIAGQVRVKRNSMRTCRSRLAAVPHAHRPKRPAVSTAAPTAIAPSLGQLQTSNEHELQRRRKNRNGLLRQRFTASEMVDSMYGKM